MANLHKADPSVLIRLPAPLTRDGDYPVTGAENILTALLVPGTTDNDLESILQHIWKQQNAPGAWRGVWDPASSYPAGSVVAWGVSIWITSDALDSGAEEPGLGPAWFRISAPVPTEIETNITLPGEETPGDLESVLQHIWSQLTTLETWRGPWDTDASYRAGEIVSHDSAIWLTTAALDDTADPPGTAPEWLKLSVPTPADITTSITLPGAGAVTDLAELLDHLYERAHFRGDYNVSQLATYRAGDLVSFLGVFFRARRTPPQVGIGAAVGWEHDWSQETHFLSFPPRYYAGIVYPRLTRVYQDNKVYQARLNESTLEPGVASGWEDHWEVIFDGDASRTSDIDARFIALRPWRGTWSGGEHYRVNDLVWGGNKLYIASAAGIGNDPTTATEYWQVVVDGDSAQDFTLGVQQTPGLFQLVPNGSGDDRPITIPLANNTSLGLMSGAEHAKLEGIETGATADQTGAEIVGLLEAITTEADKLDYGALSNTPPRFRGTWVSGSSYRVADSVWWADHIFVCRRNMSSSTTGPDGDSVNWEPLTHFRGAWTDGWFEPGDMVTYGDLLWVAKRSVRNSGAPSATGADWQRLTSHYRGVWTPGVTYYRGDSVWHADHIFICRAESHRGTANAGGPDGNSASWEPLTHYRGSWRSGQWFEPGDMVTHNNLLWVATGSIRQNDPAPTVGGAWQRLTSNFRGNWSGSETYYRGDMVWHSHLFICRTDNHRSGHGPDSDSANWDPVTDYRGNWSAGWYQPGDMVSHSGLLWVAVQASVQSHGAPSPSNGRWLRISDRFRGSWSGTATYYRGDMVWHGHLFICRTDGRRGGGGPDGNSTDWDPVTDYRGAWTAGWYQPGDTVSHAGEIWVAIASSVRTDSAPGTSGSESRWARVSNPSGAEIADLLEGISGTDKLQYSALRNTPSIPTLRTGAQTADLLEALSGTDKLDYGALRNTPDIRRFRGAWVQQNSYAQGQIVTHAGQLWIIDQDIPGGRGEPGSYAAWLLIGPTTSLPWTSITGRPTIPTLRTGAETADLLEGLSGNDRLAYSALRDVPIIPQPVTLRTASETADLLESLTGNDRLAYSALRGTPSIPALRTGAETADLLEGLSGTDKLDYAALRNTPRSAFRGAWARGAYNAQDFVFYEGKLWVANSSFFSSHVPPFETSSWTQASSSHRGAWSSSVYYAAGDTVQHSGNFWLAMSIRQPNNAAPGTRFDTQWLRLGPTTSLPWSSITGRPTFPTLLGQRDITLATDAAEVVTQGGGYTDTITIPANGRVILLVDDQAVAGEITVPASSLRSATESTRIGKLPGSGDSSGELAFFTDSDNHLWAVQDIVDRLTSCRVRVEHLADGVF